MYYVKGSMVEAAQSTQEEDWYGILKLCFDEEQTSELKLSLQKYGLLNHQSLKHWMYLYVEYIKGRANNAPMFKNNNTVVNEWFNSEGTNDTETFEIRCINLTVPGSRDIISVLGKIDVFNLSEQSHNRYYHGTIQLIAEYIREDGIRPDSGKEKQDFSHKSGFYLNPKFGNTEE